jgi:stage II sporulation protein E
MGIVNKLDLELSSKKLRKNDIILMLTDGVLDNLDGYEDKENVIRNKLKNMELKDPSHIANAILEESISSNDIKDDMTVLVTKIMLK